MDYILGQNNNALKIIGWGRYVMRLEPLALDPYPHKRHYLYIYVWSMGWSTQHDFYRSLLLRLQEFD